MRLSVKRHLLLPLLILLILALLFFCALIAVYYYLPRYAETRLLPGLAAQTGIKGLAGRVRQDGVTKTTIESIYLGDEARPLVSVDTVSAEYAPLTLWKKRKIDRILFSGVTVNLTVKDGAVDLSDVPMHLFSGDKKNDKSSERFPVSFDAVEFVHAEARIHLPDKETIRLPFSARFIPKNPELTAWRANLDVHPFGGTISTTSDVNLPEKRFDIDLTGASLPLAAAAALFPMPGNVNASGVANVTGRVSMSLSPMFVEDLSFSARLDNFNGGYGDMLFRGGHQETDTPAAATLSITSHGFPTDWRIKLAGVSMATPYPVTLENADLELVTAEGASSVSGTLETLIGTGPKFPIRLSGPLPMTMDITGRINDQDIWRATIRKKGISQTAPVAVITDAGKFTTALNGLVIEAGGDKNRIRCESSMDVEDTIIDLVSEDGTRQSVTLKGGITVPVTADFDREKSIIGNWTARVLKKTNKDPVSIEISAGKERFASNIDKLRIQAAGDPGKIQIESTIDFRHVVTALSTGNANINRLQLTDNITCFQTKPSRSYAGSATASWAGFSGDFSPVNAPGTNPVSWRFPKGKATATYQLKKDAVYVAGNTSLQDGRVRVPDSGVTVSGINGEIPFIWPLSGTTPKHPLHLEKIEFEDRHLGSAAMKLFWKDNRLHVDGTHKNSLLPGAAVTFDVSADPESAEIRSGFSLLPLTLDSDFRPETLLPALSGAVITGRLSARGKLAYSKRGIESHGNITFVEGSLAIPESRLNVKNIAFDLDLTDLLHLKSGPSQPLYFKTASLGDLNFSNGQFRFRIDRPDLFHIEKGSIGWSGGKVGVGGFALTPGETDYKLVLSCDRLQLAEMLAQFGAAKATGKGSVSGRIPLHYREGELTFNDGFLSTTPGEGGTLHLSGADILLAGIPRDSPQYVQIDLAREALKSYDYNWARVNLNTEGETFRLRLQLDGKPSDTLPFTIDPLTGGFVRDPDGPGANFQGISLDVNFRLPLNRLMKHGNTIRKYLD